MNLSRLVVAAVLAFAAFGAGAAALLPDLPDAAIESCQSRLRDLAAEQDRTTSHPFNLNERCPKLAKALATLLDDADKGVVDTDSMSVEGLRDLRSFAEGFQHLPVTRQVHRLDLNRVDDLLAEVLVDEEVEDTLWDRFLRWLEQYVKDGESPRFERFLDWLDGLDAPPWLGDVIVNTSVVLIVLLALIVIGNELRLSGLLRRGRNRRGQTARTIAGDVPGKPRIPTLDELPGLPPRQLAAGILAIVTATLAERGWLTSSSSLTNGELVRQIRQSRSVLADSFTGLVNGIEKILYGDLPPDEETRKELLAAASALIEDARRGPTTASASPG